MKLYIKQKAFSFREKFFVKDEYECDRYYIEGEVFTLGSKLHVYDLSGNEVMYIFRRPFTFLPKSDIHIGGSLFGTLTKEMSFLDQVYTFEGPGWDIEGDFTAHEYKMLRCGSVIASVKKEWFSWGDSYALEITGHADELPALGVLIAIDAINAVREAAGYDF